MQGWDSCVNCTILIHIQFSVPSCTRNLKLSLIAPHRPKSRDSVNFFKPEIQTYNDEKFNDLQIIEFVT